ncbi:Oidioi.mRNA.OKI2018_I69.chr2.g7150.t1.cds [Oikopleura dioica]|uniref:Oidioi.mRNA.OKI2018_I69.chr2.g7150.t1.cds n=1 Tax=Oikopleura dioica TaxID=34765 RepID=A0ABN7TBB6_OIKDI|nr:Oidioi.mRNA.OKI2018_I69.chr2.g7150.t1.cds [Oikopleura dioica]
MVAYKLLLPYTNLAGELVSHTKYFAFRLSSSARSGDDAVFTFTCVSARCKATEMFYGPTSMLTPDRDQLAVATSEDFFQFVSFHNHRHQGQSILHTCSGKPPHIAANAMFRIKLQTTPFSRPRRISEIRSHIDIVREDVNTVFPGFQTENSDDELIDIVLERLK